MQSTLSMFMIISVLALCSMPMSSAFRLPHMKFNPHAYSPQSQALNVHSVDEFLVDAKSLGPVRFGTILEII